MDAYASLELIIGDLKIFTGVNTALFPCGPVKAEYHECFAQRLLNPQAFVHSQATSLIETATFISQRAIAFPEALVAKEVLLPVDDTKSSRISQKLSLSFPSLQLPQVLSPYL
jgi:hypothetical protein